MTKRPGRRAKGPSDDLAADLSLVRADQPHARFCVVAGFRLSQRFAAVCSAGTKYT